MSDRPRAHRRRAAISTNQLVRAHHATHQARLHQLRSTSPYPAAHPFGLRPALRLELVTELGGASAYQPQPVPCSAAPCSMLRTPATPCSAAAAAPGSERLRCRGDERANGSAIRRGDERAPQWECHTTRRRESAPVGEYDAPPPPLSGRRRVSQGKPSPPPGRTLRRYRIGLP